MVKYIGKFGTVADGLIIIKKLDTGLKSFHLVANGKVYEAVAINSCKIAYRTKLK